MRRSPDGPTRRLVAVGGAIVLGLGLCSCAQPAGLEVVGTVVDDTVTVTVPALGAVAVDPDAGFAPPPHATVTAPHAVSAQSAPAGLGTVVGVRDVPVQEGDRVVAGDVVAILDDAQLAAQLEAAQATADVAAALPAVLQEAIDEIDDKAADIAEKRADANDAIETLTAKRRELLKARATLVDARGHLRDKRASLRRTRSDLTEQQAQLRAKQAQALDQRAQLVQQVSALQQILAQMPPDPATPLPPLPPGAPVPPSRAQVLAAIAQAEAGIAQVDAGLAQLDPALVKVDTGLQALTSGLARIDAGLDRTGAGLARIRTGLPEVDDGLARAREGRAQLDDAAAALVGARRGLRHRMDQADIAAGTARLAVQVARRTLGDATVTAPVDGVVVRAAAPGDVLAPGATLVSIRPDAPSRATVWLAPDELSQVCVGDSATLHGDWMPAGTSAPATLTRIGTRWDYPPTWHVTDEVHLTRALPVEVTASSDALPAGVPVDITIDGCRQAGPS